MTPNRPQLRLEGESMWIQKLQTSCKNKYTCIKRSLVNFVRLEDTVTKMVTRCPKTIKKVAIFALDDWKVLLVSYEKYGTLFWKIFLGNFLRLNEFIFFVNLEKVSQRYASSLYILLQIIKNPYLPRFN